MFVCDKFYRDLMRTDGAFNRVCSKNFAPQQQQQQPGVANGPLKNESLGKIRLGLEFSSYFFHVLKSRIYCCFFFSVSQSRIFHTKWLGFSAMPAKLEISILLSYSCKINLFPLLYDILYTSSFISVFHLPSLR